MYHTFDTSSKTYFYIKYKNMKSSGLRVSKFWVLYLLFQKQSKITLPFENRVRIKRERGRKKKERNEMTNFRGFLKLCIKEGEKLTD